MSFEELNHGRYPRLSKFMKIHYFSFWNYNPIVLRLRKKYGVWGAYDDLRDSFDQELIKEVERMLAEED